jgi:hypothetical protein
MPEMADPNVAHRRGGGSIGKEVAMSGATGGRFFDERPEADALDQQRPTVPTDPEYVADEEEMATGPDAAGSADGTVTASERPAPELPLEADPADAVEQRHVLPAGEDDEPR